MYQRPIRRAADGWSVEVLDQTVLPHIVRWVRLASVQDAARAIRDMVVRGAPLIGVTAAWGLSLALREDDGDAALEAAVALLGSARPTAVNLAWALDRVRRAALGAPRGERAERAGLEASALAEEEAAASRAIGEHGLELLRGAPGERAVQVLTHCNTGWLAAVEYGTALAPVYRAREAGLAVHIWVAETRPRNQGWLTAWELAAAGVPHTVVADNAVGHLLQRGMVDVVLVGADRTTRRGDVCNKVGTCLRALAAREHGVPFYVAAPSSSIDWALSDPLDIPLEERAPEEVTTVVGRDAQGNLTRVAIGSPGSPVLNVAFDVTPAALVTALITERGVCPASEAGLGSLFGGEAS